jgi:organic hydroperoxide reductase OsmC/OhrA
VLRATAIRRFWPVHAERRPRGAAAARRLWAADKAAAAGRARGSIIGSCGRSMVAPIVGAPGAARQSIVALAAIDRVNGSRSGARRRRVYAAGRRNRGGAMNESMSFAFELQQIQDYEFRVKFDWPGVPELTLDEPAPLGRASGPNAARLIGAAVANCLSSSLLFCMREFKQSPGTLRAQVRGELVRNERGRLRIGRFDVTIRLAEPASAIAHFDRCLAQFEDFCVVTESVRHGIAVGVRVVDADGAEVFAAGRAAA